MSKELKPMAALNVRGFLWFDRTPGNTYHAAQIDIDGETVCITPMAYGYGDCYLQTAQEWLSANGYLPEDAMSALWRLCEEAGATFTYGKQDCPKRKDLPKPFVREETQV